MGLYVSAYSNLKYIGGHEFDPQLNEDEPGPFCYYGNHIQAYVHEKYPHAFRGIPLIGRDDGFLLGGCYVMTPETVTHEFSAGSYTSYCGWKDDLAAHFNPGRSPGRDRPFYELIHFSDCEGVIGCEAAQKLLQDFRTYAELYTASGLDSECIGTTRYANWTRAFELAANGGLVKFH